MNMNVTSMLCHICGTLSETLHSLVFSALGKLKQENLSMRVRQDFIGRLYFQISN